MARSLEWGSPLDDRTTRHAVDYATRSAEDALARGEASIALRIGRQLQLAEPGVAAHGDLVAHKSERTGKRFIRCTNYDVCGTSYPLPARGKLEATGEYCPDCGAPLVVVTTARGPWKLCPNLECPGREKKEASSRGGRGGSSRGGRRSSTSKKKS